MRFKPEELDILREVYPVKGFRETARILGRDPDTVRRKAYKMGIPTRPSPAIKHGLYKDKAYTTWRNMLTRCYFESSVSYKYYGAKGVIVCDEWLDMDRFITWFRLNHIEGCTIDRINPRGNYEPSNCRFITQKEQTRNTTANVLTHASAAKIRELHKQGMKNKQIAELMKVSKSTVQAVTQGRYWS